VRSGRPPRHSARLAGLLAICGLLLLGAMSGCATTQETAAKKQAESKRILDAREKRQDKKRSKSDDQESKKR
jgi:outer membrane lipoprotein-sorting protein